MNAQFLAIAQDPRIIPGVHHYCDEWCDYCPVTQRCLGFLCVEAFRKKRGRTEDEETFANMDEAVRVHAPALPRSRGSGPTSWTSCSRIRRGNQASAPTTRWPSARWTTPPVGAPAVAVALQLGSRRPSRSPSGLPSPEEVVVWYHLRIYMKIFRALVSAASDCAGGPRSDDAPRVREAGNRVDRSVARGAGDAARDVRRRSDRPVDRDPGRARPAAWNSAFPMRGRSSGPGSTARSRSSIRAWPEALDRRLARRRKSCGR